jgi:hypothetical protein
MTNYNKDAVDQAIASSNRAGRKVGGREAKRINALLRGCDPVIRAAIDSGKLIIVKG